jgi:hypothetical protein
VALIVRHPYRNPSDLAQAFGLVPSVTHTAGMPRAAPNGQRLSGIYRESYCCFDIEIRDDFRKTTQSLAGFLRQKATLLKDWRSEGAGVSCAVSISGAGSQAVLPSALLGACAESSITVELSIYEVVQQYVQRYENRLEENRSS